MFPRRCTLIILYDSVTLLVWMFQSPDGKFIASGAIDGIVNVFDITTGKLIHTLEGMYGIICRSFHIFTI